MRSHTILFPFLVAAVPAQDPHAFLPNRGQWPAAVHAVVEHGALTTWLTTAGFTTRVLVETTPRDPRGGDGPDAPLPSARTAVLDVEFVAGGAPRAAFGERLPGSVGFFLGDDPAAWVADVPRHAGCELPAVWPGVDVVWGTRGAHVAYDLRVAPAVDARTIGLRLRGAERIAIGDDGALELDVGFGVLRHGRPVAFQLRGDGVREELAAAFVLRGDVVGFDVQGRDPALPLVIDPPLLWTSMLGGNGNDGTAYRQVLDRDAAGNLAICGYTGSTNFPAPGATQGTWDGFVSAFSPIGVLLWSARIGGTQPGDEWLRTCRWDGAGGVFFAGSSASANYPTTPGAYQPAPYGPTGLNHWGDMVMGRLAPSPTGMQLAWSTLLGGSGEETANGLAVLSCGRVAVTGWSGSTAPTRPPGLWTHAGAAQPQSRGAFNAYFAIFDPSQTGAAQCTHATWWGGTGTDDTPGCLVVDANCLLVCGGWTNSTNVATTANAIQPTYQGGSHDGYLVAFDPTLSAAIYSSYLGGPGYDQANDVAIDAAGRWVVANWTGAGFSPSITFPACAFQPTPGGTDDGYALLLDPWVPPAQQVVWGTYLGGTLRDGVNGVAVDAAGRITVVGSVETATSTVPLTNFPVSAWCAQPSPANGPGGTAGHWDAFVARFDPRRCGADQLVYATFLGGTGFDYAYDVVLDERSRPLVVGATSSAWFPPGVGRPGGNQDIFITSLDLVATVADRLGAPSPACGTAFLDAYHRQMPGGFDVAFTCSAAPPSSVGWLLIGYPDAIGATFPGLGVTSHLALNGPIVTFATFATDATGHASHRFTAPLLPPVHLAVQSVWLGGCSPIATSDAIRF